MKVVKTDKTGMVARTVLENGLVVLTEDIPMYASASLGVWINVGSKHEAENDAGISHFIEHMLFKGTPTRSAYDIADVMEGVGGYLNGTTDKEQTCYSCRVMDKHVDLSMDLIGDMIRNSLYDPEELEREKNVVLDEIKTYEDSPPDVIHDMFLRTTWKGHPLGRSTIGTEEVIRAANRAQMMHYQQTHYNPGNMLVTVAGRVDHDRVVEKTLQWFGDMKNPRHEFSPALPQVDPRCVYRNRDTEQIYLCMGGEGLPMAHEGKYKLQMLDNVLGGGMSSRLFQEIREKRGLVYNVGSFVYSYMDGGVFGVYVVAGPDAMREVMPLLRDICADVRENGITEREFERSREYLKGSFALGLESSSMRMMRLLRSETGYGRFVPPEEVVARIDAVTIEDVNQYASQYLDLDRFCFTALGPFRGTRRKLLRELAPGAWEEDVGPYDRPRRKRKSADNGEAVNEEPQPVISSRVHVT
ncbi:MAG: insulinase family protein [Armatimonadetes bacterium]|nr:insulinase family protein [Armatimonadota bacterium]